MKKTKLFAKIVYYLFTFSIGILLALFLPYYYFEVASLDLMSNYLEQGSYADAMALVGGYYDTQCVFQQNFESGGGIVLFNAATLVTVESEDADAQTSFLHKSYAGFVYGVGDTYQITEQGKNKTKLIVTDLEGETHTVEILDYDINQDESKDTNAICYQKGFFYLDLDKDALGSIQKLTFLDKDGNVFAEISQLNLDYSQQFFDDVDAFLTEYNRNYKSELLIELNEAFLAKSENNAMSSHDKAMKESGSNTKATVVVIVYFICVYIVADFLLGYHYIIQFVKWVLVKVFKVKFKPKPVKYEETFGHDYYSQVTFALDVSELDNFSESVQIRYSNEEGEVAFILLKEQNYTVTQRVKAGVYVNPWIDLDRHYAPQNLPETLVVEGYQKGYKIKILRREE